MPKLNNSELKAMSLQFFTSFRQRFSAYLKEGVAMMVSFFPFPDGIVAVVNLNKSNKWQNEIKSDSSSLIEALKKTDLFDFRDQSPSFKTPTFAVTSNKLVFVKSNNSSEWDDNAMDSDISGIISRIKDILNSESKVLVS